MANKSFFHSGYGSGPQSGASNINALDARSCPGVFTDQFIFRTVFGTNFEYLLNPTNLSAKP